jgi:hypothetical protein
VYERLGESAGGSFLSADTEEVCAPALATVIFPNSTHADGNRAVKCPNCNLLNPERAQRCDCGYDFENKRLVQRYLNPDVSSGTLPVDSSRISPGIRIAFVWLPMLFVLRDIAAWVYVFSYEPGITEKAVRIHHFLLMPGVFYSVGLSTPINIGFGIVLGGAIRIAREHRFPLTFTILVLAWDSVVTGILDFAALGSGFSDRLYFFGMMPGRFVSHILAHYRIVSNGQVLFTCNWMFNGATALLLTAAYCRLVRPWFRNRLHLRRTGRPNENV